MADYIPSTDSELKSWLENFNLKLPAHAGTFGITTAQLASVNADQLNFSYWFDQNILFRDEKEERVSYKNLLRDGPIGTPAGTPPTPPVIPAAPAAVLPGIVPRSRELAQFLKNHPSYTVSIGQDLDIIGTEDNTQKSTLKPILKLTLEGPGVKVQWKKGIAEGIRIEKDSGSGWALIGIDVEPDFTDTTPITAPAMWKYRAKYLISDEPVGLWSDVASIAVA